MTAGHGARNRGNEIAPDGVAGAEALAQRRITPQPGFGQLPMTQILRPSTGTDRIPKRVSDFPKIMKRNQKEKGVVHPHGIWRPREQPLRHGGDVQHVIDSRMFDAAESAFSWPFPRDTSSHHHFTLHLKVKPMIQAAGARWSAPPLPFPCEPRSGVRIRSEASFNLPL